eukprot:CAMPEP_0116875598 /NCGR_PEP_ID=MMETSP0463-20121206/7628_1 /TAXON_ID=181622 /ORGANISM="Strombidinopsis sp, Strain SopsisLIS2011" /LENGTH=122 /DNA_ID=CAMNT_0004521539 /DNA_START=259 /DNA_END=627 /DNA_ORIENTATION=+
MQTVTSFRATHNFDSYTTRKDITQGYLNPHDARFENNPLPKICSKYRASPQVDIGKFSGRSRLQSSSRNILDIHCPTDVNKTLTTTFDSRNNSVGNKNSMSKSPSKFFKVCKPQVPDNKFTK